MDINPVEIANGLISRPFTTLTGVLVIAGLGWIGNYLTGSETKPINWRRARMLALPAIAILGASAYWEFGRQAVGETSRKEALPRDTPPHKVPPLPKETPPARTVASTTTSSPSISEPTPVHNSGPQPAPPQPAPTPPVATPCSHITLPISPAALATSSDRICAFAVCTSLIDSPTVTTLRVWLDVAKKKAGKPCDIADREVLGDDAVLRRLIAIASTPATSTRADAQSSCLEARQALTAEITDINLRLHNASDDAARCGRKAQSIVSPEVEQSLEGLRN